MKLSLVALVLFAVTCTFAQNYSIDLLRQDIKSEKFDLMAGSLPLTDKQAAAFWPLYRDYSHELGKLADRRIAVVKVIFAKYDSLDAKTADRLVKESIKIANGRNALLEKYYGKIAKALGAVTAARFLQVETQMLTVLDAQLMDEVPLIKVKASGDAKK